MKTPYRMNINDVPPFKVAPPSQEKPSAIDVKMVYGTDTGMMLAKREEGYHSRPHHHDSEQWNYIMEGEIWFFINEEGFRCRQGDIVRIPRNAIHWTWVRHTSGCTMLETHTPSLTVA
jgi:quercetin dioxygenase-like cupin family protein